MKGPHETRMGGGPPDASHTQLSAGEHAEAPAPLMAANVSTARRAFSASKTHLVGKQFYGGKVGGSVGSVVDFQFPGQ